MTGPLALMAHRHFERTRAQNDMSREWDEPAPRAVKDDRLVVATDHRWYFRLTNYRVTDETFAAEERRKGRDLPGDLPDVPPPGLVCSARLGAVSTLL